LLFPSCGVRIASVRNIHTMRWSIPTKKDPALLSFVAALWDQPVRNLPEVPHKLDGKLLSVRVRPRKGCYADYCWYNCLQTCQSQGGEIVFGWSLYRTTSGLLAQHHAVWQPPTGEIIDITPNPDTNEILFVPDRRAAFDFNALRCPPNFERGPSGDAWVSKERSERVFWIAALVPEDDPPQRRDWIAKVLRAAGYPRT
jgi:hypothetical protein